MKQAKHCPVCNMSVADNTISAVYRGLEFWFCSTQCRNRFKLIPELFIGDPKHGKSAKQLGISVEKQRTFRLAVPEDKSVQELIAARLGSLMGVNAVNITANTLEIDYDLVQISLEDIEKTLREMQVGITASWLDKFRQVFAHFSEDNQLYSLKHPTKHSGCH